MMQVQSSLDLPISSLKLSVRSANCLRDSQIKTISQLVQTSPADLLKIKNFGKKSLAEMQAIVQQMGFYLGMTIVPESGGVVLAGAKIDEQEPPKVGLDPDSYEAILLPIYEQIKNVRIDTLPFTVRALRCFAQHRVASLGDLFKLNMEETLKWRNFGKKSVKDTTAVLKAYIEYVEAQKNGSAKISSEELIKAIERTLGESKYYVFTKRVIDDSEYKETLEQVAKKFNITRERVRQIESKLISIIDRHHVGTTIKNYIKIIYDFITSKGGIVEYNDLLNNCLNEPHAEISNLWMLLGFNNLTCDKKIYLIKIFGRRIISLTDKETLKNAYKELENEITQYYGLTIDQLKEALQQDLTYGQLIEDLCLEHFIKERGIFRDHKLIGIKGEPLRNIEYIYLSHGKSIRDEQAKKEYVKVYGNNLSDMAFRGSKDRCDNLVLWGRGEYIHKALISINETHLEKVYERIQKAINNHEKKTSAIAIFNENQELMDFLHIPTPQALYSILRMEASDRYLYRKYPDIEHSANAKRSRVERDDEVEKYFISQNKDLFLDELSAYFVAKRGLKEYLIFFAIDRCANIYKLGSNRWIHSKLLRLSAAKIRKIVEMSQQALLGKKYILLSELLETAKLPDISPYHWNRTLLSSVLRKNSELKLLLNIAVISSEHSSIKTIDDLVVDIVKSNPKQFSKITLSLYLKSKKITANPNFIGSFIEKYGFLLEKTHAI